MPVRIRLILGALVLGACALGTRAIGTDAPADCTDPEGPLVAECLPGGTAGQFLGFLCSYHWIDAACGGVALPDPGYVATSDPHPGVPFALRVGAVHNHSSYSDGDPTSIPADYYRAAKIGRNVADAGGDTGVILDFMFGSEHSDNTQIPITTAAVCADPTSGKFLIPCFHGNDMDHYWKWPATLRQAREASDASFTAGRGFEWTNDYFNHLGVYFSTNFSNVKVDGSYASMDFFWNWLREPVSKGGGADGLVVFNHPGGDPHLTPLDGGFPHTKVLAQFPGGGNWNDLAYVSDVDDRVAAMEVNGGDDIEWYVKGLTRGWHIGAVANEDEHEREWSTSREGKTLMLTRGTSVRDYYWALKNHRTIAIRDPLVDGAPGTKAAFPTIHYYADATGINEPSAVVLGSTIAAGGAHALHVDVAGLPGGSRLALVSNRTQGQSTPIQLGTVAEDGTAAFAYSASSPASGEDWYFAVVCPPTATAPCGSNQDYTAVTAPIWLRSAPAAPAAPPAKPGVKVTLKINLP